MARLPTRHHRDPQRATLVEAEPVLEASELLIARRRCRIEGVPVRVYRGAVAHRRGLRRRSAWAVIDLVFVLLLAAVLVLNASDVIITLAHVLNVGWDAEANPLARIVGVRGGPLGLIALKAAALSVSIPVMWHMYRIGTQAALTARAPQEREAAESARRAMLACTLGLTLFYTWVIQNNLRVVGVFRTALGLIGL